MLSDPESITAKLCRKADSSHASANAYEIVGNTYSPSSSKKYIADTPAENTGLAMLRICRNAVWFVGLSVFELTSVPIFSIFINPESGIG